MTANESTRSRGLQVGRIAGVPVYIGASWLVLAGVIILWWGSGLAPQLGPSAYLVGAVYAFALLLAVLVHEAAHAVIARSVGLPVHRVVADLWGGHTAYDPRGATPGRSALIAVVGPLANVGLAGLAYAVGLSLGDGLTARMLAGFVFVNLLLAAFNLLPGLPLDGGQLVDALIWHLTGKRHLGLIGAGWCGRAVALLVALWAISPLLRGGSPSLTSILWLLLIAGFMWQGASGAIQHGKARQALALAPRLGALAHAVQVVASTTPIREVIARPELAVARTDAGVPALLLLPDQVEGGVQAVPPATPVGSLMVRIPDGNTIEADPNEDLTAAVAAMQNSRWGVVVLCRGSLPWGVIGADAINHALGEPAAGTERAAP